MDRKTKILQGINWKNKKGLEIGPLCRPIVSKKETENIIYLDYLSTEQLKEKYKSHHLINDLVDIDYVLNPSRSLSSLLEKELPFDYIIASHVIEHVPNPISWLRELYTILSDSGILALAIPDKRFCFDYLRQVSSTSELIHAYLTNTNQPSPRAIFDQTQYAVKYQNKIAWQQNVDESHLIRIHTIEEAFQRAKRANRGEYIDIHSWVFTPQSFFENIRDIAELGLINYKLYSYYETCGHEFFVSFQKATKETEGQKITNLIPIGFEYETNLRSSVIEIHLKNPDSQLIYDFNIDSPQNNVQIAHNKKIDLYGWVVGHQSPAIAIEIIKDDLVISEAPVNIKRPRVATRFANILGADKSGFRCTIEQLHDSLLIEVHVQAVLKDKTRVPLAVMCIKPLPS